mmetsp:Transcript_47521/g.88951  ORF Transcript_47521/g.88951 Transcript_47521/m.88951 type:complete len:252 (+) Transcript_47521:152-907(+)
MPVGHRNIVPLEAARRDLGPALQRFPDCLPRRTQGSVCSGIRKVGHLNPVRGRIREELRALVLQQGVVNALLHHHGRRGSICLNLRVHLQPVLKGEAPIAAALCVRQHPADVPAEEDCREEQPCQTLDAVHDRAEPCTANLSLLPGKPLRLGGRILAISSFCLREEGPLKGFVRLLDSEIRLHLVQVVRPPPQMRSSRSDAVYLAQLPRRAHVAKHLPQGANHSSSSKIHGVDEGEPQRLRQGEVLAHELA